MRPISAQSSSPTSPLFQRKRLRFHSLIFEISVIYTIVLAIILLVFSSVIYSILSQTLYAELDTEVRLKAQEVSANIRSYLEVKGAEPDALKSALEKTIAGADVPQRRWWYIGFERSWSERLDEQDRRNDYLNFLTLNGESLLHSKNIEPDFLKLLTLNGRLSPAQDERLYYLQHHTQQIRVINSLFKDGEQSYILQVGVSVSPVLQLLSNWMNSVFLSIPIFLLLTSFIGTILASRIIKPVHKISKAANAISYADLTKRVEKENTYEEMDSLIEAFNGMIDRLEKSFNHIQNFSSHIAHELKTPLTIMRGETELALHGERSVQEYKEALGIILGEIQTMLKVIQDLLFLTKTDNQPGAFNFESIDFISYFQEIYEQIKILSADKGITIRLIAPFKEKIFVRGDPIHLRRLFFNILDNAIKYSPEHGRIEIYLEQRDKKIMVSISDQGIGIPAEKMEKIFERFYTVDQHQFGCGLGLSIAQSIVTAHNGRIEVKSQPGQGSTFTVILPLI